MADNNNEVDGPSADHRDGADVAAANRVLADASDCADELEETGEFLPLKISELESISPPAEAAVSPAPAEPGERATFWLSHLEREIQRLQGKWEVVAGELKVRETLIEQLRTEASERDAAIAAFTHEVEEQVATNESLEAELARANNQIADLIARNDSRALELSQRTNELAEANALIEDLQDQTAVYEASIAQLTHGIEQGRIAAQEKDRRLAEQIVSANDLRATIQDLESYIDGRTQVWFTLNAKVAEHQDELEKLERLVEQKDAELAAATKEQEPLKAKIADLEHTRAELAAHQKEREAAYKELQALFTEQIATTTQLRSELVNAAQDAESKRAAIEAERDQLGARIVEVTANLRARDDRIASLEAGISAAEQAMRDAGDRAARHEIKFAEGAAEAANLRRELEARAEVVVRLEFALSARQRALDLLERNVQRLDQLGASLAGLDDKFSSVGAEIVAANLRAANGNGNANGNGGSNGNGGASGRELIAIDGAIRRSYALHDGEMTIGRSRESDIRIASPLISRVHARICMHDSAAIIEDLGSKNGVLVNDTRVVHQTALHDGDVISLGGTLKLTFVDHDRPHPPDELGAATAAS
jgi:septal ring factor EnvC (AmiA/AmiB activator)